MPPDSGDRDLGEGGAGEVAAGAQSPAAPAGDSRARAGRFATDGEPSEVREPTFGGDTFGGATNVITPPATASLAARVDALMAAGLDGDGDDEDEELSITGTRPLGSNVDLGAGLGVDLTLGPAGSGEVALPPPDDLVGEVELAAAGSGGGTTEEDPGAGAHASEEIEAHAAHHDPLDDEPPTGVRPPSEPVPHMIDAVDEADHDASRAPKAAAVGPASAASGAARAAAARGDFDGDEVSDVSAELSLDDADIQAEATPLPQRPPAEAPAPPPPRPMAPRGTTIGMAVVPPPIPRFVGPGAGAGPGAPPPPIPRPPAGAGAPPPIPRPPTGAIPAIPIPRPPGAGAPPPVTHTAPAAQVAHVPPPPHAHVPPPHAPLPHVHVPPPAEAPRRPETAAPLRADSEADRHLELSGASIPLDLADPEVAEEIDSAEPVIEAGIDLSPGDDGMAPSSMEATVAPHVPLEAHLEVPTAIDRALAESGEAALEKRAAELSRDLDRASDRAHIAGLAYELGELFERRLADEARAVKAFGRALQTDPSLKPNLWAIRRVFYRRGLWPNLMKLIDAELRFAKSDAERADLLTEKGLILADRLGQPVEARQAFEQAAEHEPRALAPLLQLERLVAQAGDDAALAAVWEKLAAASERPERRLVHLLELVRYWAEQGPDGVARAKGFVDQAVALGVDGERVAAERLRVAELSGDAEEILAALDAQAQLLLAKCGPAGAPEASAHARAPGAPLDRATALRLELVAVRRRQAQEARKVGQADRAWDYLQQALALAPGEPILLADLADLAEELGRFGELAELVESWQALEGDPARALMLSIRRADALLRGGQRDQARALLASLEAGAPGFLPITALVERDALAAGDWPALARALAGAAEAARAGTTFGPGQTHAPDPAAAAAIYVAVAEIWATAAGAGAAADVLAAADSEARAALGLALELVPGHAAATQALVELHERAGRIDEAAAVLDAAAGAAGADPDARAAALERLARLHRDHHHAAAATAAEKRLLALAPDDVRLAWRVDAGLAEQDDPPARAERVEHLAQLARRDPDPARRGVALITAAHLAEEAGDRARAVELYRGVLGVWPGDRYARGALVELLRAGERWDELVAERRAEAAELADGAAAVRALREVAWVLEERLGRPADAAAAYRDVLDRAPDDAHAQLGLARALAAAGERDGHLAALEQRADAATGPAAVIAAIELALAQERAGRLDDALDSYRRAAVAAAPPADAAAGGDPAAAAARTVGAVLASAAMVDLAVARGDTAARVEAMTELARGTTDPTFAAALHEDIGWLYALVLEDFDQAAAAFATAIATGSGRASPQRGALLGAALVAARRGEAVEQSAAYDRLAAALAQPPAGAAAGSPGAAPGAAVAMYLRAAALAAAAGDGDQAAARVARARAASADDVGALVVTAEHAPPAVPPRKTDDVAGAVDQLLARAEVLTMRADMADDPSARASWELDRAEALECAGRLKEAGAVVAAVLRQAPDDLRALEALRRLTRRGGDRPSWARASLALASRIGDGAAKLALLREAAAIFDPAGQPEGAALAAAERPDGSPGGAYGSDPAAAVAVYKRILAEAPGAPEFARLCQIARQHGDVRVLALAIADRLAWIDGEADAGAEPDAARDPARTPAAAVPLLLERARVRRAHGDARGAAADLDDLLRRDGSHVEGLAMRAGLALDLGDAQRATELWRAYLAVEPDADRRADAELTLSKILAENMDDVQGAIDQLERVIAAAPRDVGHRERLVGLATRAQDWTRVARELREITRLRPTAGERAREELRLAEILRDRVGDAAGARAALERGRGHDPLSLDVVAALGALVSPADRGGLFAAAAADLRDAIVAAPARAALYDRLATVCGWQGDLDGRWLALVAVEAMGQPSGEQKALLAAGRARTAPVSRQPLDAARRAALRPDPAAGLVGELWRTISPAVTAGAGLDPQKLGFAKGDKVALKQLAARKYDALAAALASLGLDDVELYVSDGRAGQARVLGGETPILCVGADVATGASGPARFALGRAAMLAAEGTGTMVELREAEVTWWLAAALRAVDAALPPGLAEAVAQDGADPQVAERARLCGKHLGRKDKKALAALAARGKELARADQVAAWRKAAVGCGQRAGLLAASDLAVALAMLDVGRGARALADNAAALELCAWSVSAAHAGLRRDLGYAISAGGSP